MSGGLPVSALYAGLLGLLAVALANNVLYARLRAGRLPAWKPDAQMRVQANFVENVPLALLLLFALELQGTGTLALHVFGSSLVVCRLLHAWGLGSNEGANYPRLIGAQGTFLLMSIMGVALVYGYAIG
ncbi:MAG: MAPEG family protein [Steroidobacteraceae bacterium]